MFPSCNYKAAALDFICSRASILIAGATRETGVFGLRSAGADNVKKAGQNDRIGQVLEES
jgi:hypothetical protein